MSHAARTAAGAHLYVNMINEHDRVVLTAAVPSPGLVSGDVGTVVHVYEDGKAFEVEFVTLDGQTAAVATIEAVVACSSTRFSNRSLPAPLSVSESCGHIVVEL